MHKAILVRAQLEASLVDRVPNALTPRPHVVRAVEPVGIKVVDELLQGGLPLGAITEIVGPECSGRTSFSLSFLAQMTQTGKICAWVDVSSNLHPESAAAVGVDLCRLLWVRCGVQSKAYTAESSSVAGFVVPETYFIPPFIKKGLHGGGRGPYLRTDAKRLSDAVGGLLKPEQAESRCVEPQHGLGAERDALEHIRQLPNVGTAKSPPPNKYWKAIENALRVTDLLLQAGGFGAIVLDMGSIAPEFIVRIPLSTWFRYQKAVEISQASVLLLTQHSCAKSSAGLVLRFEAGTSLLDEATVFAGMEYSIELTRERSNAVLSHITPMRKTPERKSVVHWRGRTAWTGSR